MFSIVSIGTIILQSGINGLGTQIIAAHTAARKLISLFCLPLSTLAASMATFVSQNKGAQNYDRILKGVRLANTCGVIYPIFLSIFIFLTARYLVHFLNLRNAIQGFGYKITPLISSIIELVGKIVFTVLLVPKLKYIGVCVCEPVIWCLMTCQLVYSYRKITSIYKTQQL